MKLVKGILYFLFIMLGAALLAALFAPSTKEVRRIIKIEAPVDAVYSQVATFENWTNWDARYEKDPSQKRTYNGSAGDKTYGYKWKSDNKDVGAGAITMNTVKHNERLDYTLSVEDKSTRGYFTFTPESGTTEVEWVMVSELSYPMTIINYFIDGMVGGDLKIGLENLKEYTEKTPIDELAPEVSPIQIVEEHGVNYALIKGDNISKDEQASFFNRGYQKVFTHIQTHGLMPKGPPRGLFYNWDEEKGTATLAAAVPISEIMEESEAKIESGLTYLYLGSNYIRGTADGGNSKVYEMHALLSDWIESSAKKPKMPVVEEYIKGPNDVQDTSQYSTNVMYYFE